MPTAMGPTWARDPPKLVEGKHAPERIATFPLRVSQVSVWPQGG